MPGREPTLKRAAAGLYVEGIRADGETPAGALRRLFVWSEELEAEASGGDAGRCQGRSAEYPTDLLSARRNSRRGWRWTGRVARVFMRTSSACCCRRPPMPCCRSCGGGLTVEAGGVGEEFTRDCDNQMVGTSQPRFRRDHGAECLKASSCSYRIKVGTSIEPSRLKRCILE